MKVIIMEAAVRHLRLLFGTLLVGSSLLGSWLPAAAMDSASLSSLDNPEIGLALGDLMSWFDFNATDAKLPSTESEIADTRLFPIEADTLVVQFPQSDIQRDDDTWRLVLTEHGLWGFAAIKRGNDRRILSQRDLEAMLQDFQENHRAWAAIRKPIPLANGLIALTRGEIYPLETTDRARIVVDQQLSLTKSKYADIEKLPALPSDIERSGDRYLIPMGNDYSGSISILTLRKIKKFYDQQLDPLTIRKSRARAELALKALPKFIAMGTGDRLDCNEVQSYIKELTSGSSRELSAKINLDLGKFLSAFFPVAESLGISAGFDDSMKSSLEEKITQTVTQAALSFDYDNHLLEQGGSLATYVIGNSRNCQQSNLPGPDGKTLFDEVGNRFFRVSVPDVAGFLIGEDIFKALGTEVPTATWNGTTGKLVLSCYTRDYLPMIDYMHDQLQLPATASDYILEHISFVKKRSFFDC